MALNTIEDREFTDTKKGSKTAKTQESAAIDK
jgi:hypothetical protein